MNCHIAYLTLHPILLSRPKTSFSMCCWPFVDVVLEDPPPPPKVEEEKKEFHLVSDKPNLIGVSQQAMLGLS